MQREAFDRVREEVERQFQERIRVRRIDQGIPDDLERLLQGFKQKGITQWWHNLDTAHRPRDLATS